MKLLWVVFSSLKKGWYKLLFLLDADAKNYFIISSTFPFRACPKKHLELGVGVTYPNVTLQMFNYS